MRTLGTWRTILSPGRTAAVEAVLTDAPAVVNEYGNMPVSGDAEDVTVTDLVTNRDFSAGTTGWTSGFGTTLTPTADVNAPGGNYVEVSAVGSSGWICQQLTVESGKTYLLKVWVKGGTLNDYRVSVGGAEEGYDMANENFSGADWTERLVVFTATGSIAWIGVNIDFGPGTVLVALVAVTEI